ncbi:hypothetical protein [Providencia sp. Je.9.19]|uniref:tail fiber/spike domain-containing protein n=1 Tax=Providencia sp. Je.9.19 TaxID=3142844 RepID=UPI003DA870D8
MREVKPTQKPVPSSDIKDLFFNSGKIDEWVNSLQHEYTDRFGKCHKTAAGMEWVFNQLVEMFKVDALNAILAVGYAPAGTFQEGAEVKERNETVLWKLPDGDGDYYRWDGNLEKNVPMGSSPHSAGGIGKGAWINVGDITLRPLIDKKQGAFSVSALESGCVNDRLTDNTPLIQQLIDTYSGRHIYLTIEPNILWHADKITMRNGVNVLDYSGWDYAYNQWNEHIKFHMNHIADDNQHNGNGLHILAKRHPHIMIDNIGGKNDPAGENYRSSVIFRVFGKLKARLGIGASDTDTNFIITGEDLSARYAFKNTEPGDFEQSWNAQPVNDVDYFYGSKADQAQIHRKVARTGFGVSEQYYSGSLNQLVRINYNTDGSIQYSQLGAVTLNISSSGAVYGQKKRILKETSYNLAASESGTICANVSSGSSSTYILPVGVSGIYYTLVNTSGTNLSVNTRAGESFIDGSTSKTINARGSNITCLCIGTGSWVMY